MNNSDLPAMPVELSGFGQYAPIAYIGMTKREMMAMNAPEMPNWFGEEWSMKFAGNDRYFNSDVDEYGCAIREKTKSGRSAMYFAWRAHYADELLAELERTCQKS